MNQSPIRQAGHTHSDMRDLDPTHADQIHAVLRVGSVQEWLKPVCGELVEPCVCLFGG